jgi:DMSO/TMAO reductase YedYZ heme-binding membrane subunit
MIVGHYAAALIPYSRLKKYPFWLLLLCANVPEFLWLALALFNVEPASPPSLFDATLQNLRVAMTYSHNLVPGLLQGAVVAALVYACWRNRSLALWCGFLTILHVLIDLVVGFEHQVLAPDSASISLNTYGTMPFVALAIELVFVIACVYWYQYQEKKSGRTLSRKRIFALYSVFIVGVAIWAPTATVSMRDQLMSFGIAI